MISPQFALIPDQGKQLPCVSDLRYSADAGERGVGDLFLPLERGDRCPVLLIHGGGWNAMSKEAMAPVASLFTEDRRAVFSVNYRLLDDAPWPACSDDCLAAARFVLEGGLEAQGVSAADRILVCGASAGGHLAMVTGLRLPTQHVEAIVSLAGPSRMDSVREANDNVLSTPGFLRQFFGIENEPTRELVEEASPAMRARPGAPRLACIHSVNDRLVLPRHSEEAVAAWHRVGAEAELLTFAGTGDRHGLWDSDDLATRQIFVPADALIRKVLSKLG